MNEEVNTDKPEDVLPAGDPLAVAISLAGEEFVEDGAEDVPELSKDKLEALLSGVREDFGGTSSETSAAASQNQKEQENPEDLLPAGDPLAVAISLAGEEFVEDGAEDVPELSEEQLDSLLAGVRERFVKEERTEEEIVPFAKYFLPLAAAAALVFAAVRLYDGGGVDPNISVASVTKPKSIRTHALIIAHKNEGGIEIAGEPLGDKSYFSSGEKIETGDGGELSVSLSRNTQCTALKDTVFRVYRSLGMDPDKMQKPPADLDSETKIHLEQGELFVSTKKTSKGSSFDVDVVWGRLEITGTEFRVKVLPDPEKVTVDVAEGSVLFYEDGERNPPIRINEGESFTFIKNNDNSDNKPVPLGEQESQRILAENNETKKQAENKGFKEEDFIKPAGVAESKASRPAPLSPSINTTPKLEIWRNVDIRLDREKLDELLRTEPHTVKDINFFEFDHNYLHDRKAYHDWLYVIRGYFKPPEDGTYTMTLNKRVQGIWGEKGLVGRAELWFQLDPDKADSFKRVSYLTGKKSPGENTPANAKGFSLKADKQYYFEYVHEYGQWQRRTGMAGGFTLHGDEGNLVKRMTGNEHFIGGRRAVDP